MNVVLLLFFLIWGAIEWFSFQAFRTLIQRKKVLVLYQVVSLLFAIYFLYTISQFDRSKGQTRQTMFILGLVLMVYLPKIVLTIVMLAEDIFRIGKGSVTFLVKKKRDQPFFASEENL